MEIFNQIKILKEYSKNNYDIVLDAQGLLKSGIVMYINIIKKRSTVVMSTFSLIKTIAEIYTKYPMLPKSFALLK